MKYLFLLCLCPLVGCSMTEGKILVATGSANPVVPTAPVVPALPPNSLESIRTKGPIPQVWTIWTADGKTYQVNYAVWTGSQIEFRTVEGRYVCASGNWTIRDASGE